MVDSIVSVVGDIETSGDKLKAPSGLLVLFDNFLRWEPIPPRNARDLAHISARLCRFLRDEVTEQLALGNEALTALATDWRKLLFPEATDAQFADGYAQAVTFGLLMARANEISLATGLDQVAAELAKTNSLIGAALRLLTDDADNQATLKTSLGTLTRVLDAVNWPTISKGNPDAWLYFYEDFLEVYDNELRKLTGSYYTPPEVVGAMVRLVDDVLRTDRFRLHAGLASPAVTLADPAVGTGTFLLGVLRKIADTVEADEGAGSVRGAIDAAVKRLIAFEMQLGPFAVAQLRVLAELVELIGALPPDAAADVRHRHARQPRRRRGLDSRDARAHRRVAAGREQDQARGADHRRASAIRRTRRRRRGAAAGSRAKVRRRRRPLLWPTGCRRPSGAGAHSKHLRNLYVYFWRWATWKVFDHDPASEHRHRLLHHRRRLPQRPRLPEDARLPAPHLRRHLGHRLLARGPSARRRHAHLPGRAAAGLHRARRRARRRATGPRRRRCASTRCRSGNRHGEVRGARRAEARGERAGSTARPTGARRSCPASTGAWATFPTLEDLFVYNGSGVMPGRTWIIAPDAESLEQALADAHECESGRERRPVPPASTRRRSR